MKKYNIEKNEKLKKELKLIYPNGKIVYGQKILEIDKISFIYAEEYVNEPSKYRTDYFMSSDGYLFEFSRTYEQDRKTKEFKDISVNRIVQLTDIIWFGTYLLEHQEYELYEEIIKEIKYW